MRKRYIVERVLVVSHQTVVYAEDKDDALRRFWKNDVDPEVKPYYEVANGLKSIRAFEGTEQ
jgi:hypothetical protein